MDVLFEKIKKIIAEKLEVDERKVTMGASFREDLGADSLDTYELVYAAEEEMGITIPDDTANKFKTVRDAYEYIKSQVTSNGTTGATSTSRKNESLKNIMNENPTNASEQTMIGESYQYGEGVPKDMEKAAYWYQKAAEQGYANAQNNLGILYENGDGVPQDWKKATYWWAKAAEQGHVLAQCNLGNCYDDGNGVPQDNQKAAYWWTKAAEQGNAPAQCNLGVCYSKGKGVPQDKEKAKYWYTKAANQGHEGAKNNLSVLSSGGSSGGIGTGTILKYVAIGFGVLILLQMCMSC